MTKIRSGIDLVEIQRFRKLNPSILQHFIQRVLTRAEQAESSGSLIRLAGKFAAKEAAVKAVGCGIGPVCWQEIEILHNSAGQPTLVLYGNAMKFAIEQRITDWSVSISHTADYAVAEAVFASL